MHKFQLLFQFMMQNAHVALGIIQEENFHQRLSFFKISLYAGSSCSLFLNLTS